MRKQGKILLLPMELYEDAAHTIPSYAIEAIKTCNAFFAENEKTTRRFFKRVWKEMVIDDYRWYTIHKAEETIKKDLLKELMEGNTVGIISEAGCAGIADPGQILVSLAQEKGFRVQPFVGPSSILLALMASGMNGQSFQFNGYLPIESGERKKKIKELETIAIKQQRTQLFIETPYRNNQLLKDIIDSCTKETKLCIAVDITAPSESIKTKTIRDWMVQLPDLHKKPVLFLLGN
ncbi:MAG: hypothetical protein RL596_2256 [Bacteroidota bacterium]